MFQKYLKLKLIFNLPQENLKFIISKTEFHKVFLLPRYLIPSLNHINAVLWETATAWAALCKFLIYIDNNRAKSFRHWIQFHLFAFIEKYKALKGMSLAQEHIEWKLNRDSLSNEVRTHNIHRRRKLNHKLIYIYIAPNQFTSSSALAVGLLWKCYWI